MDTSSNYTGFVNPEKGTNSSSFGGTLIVIAFVAFTICVYIWHCHLKRVQRKAQKRTAEAADDLEDMNEDDFH